MPAIRYLALIVWVAFSAYTIYCMRRENFWKSLRSVLALKWGRQVTLDLYIGLFIFSFFIYLNEGSFLIWLAWLIPTLVLGNLVPLLYLVIHFESIARHFI
jgi:hypothetical protein